MSYVPHHSFYKISSKAAGADQNEIFLEKKLMYFLISFIIIMIIDI